MFLWEYFIQLKTVAETEDLNTPLSVAMSGAMAVKIT
jgi:hypothetical protein